ncbi:hypothetical protein [Peterkaempfera sp. SMS 1(5)a]|uniref:hypothetical protein n=1 Tax=Peterkaempfera podocarpi TaxID=3232308 RepID=UPI00366D7051
MGCSAGRAEVLARASVTLVELPRLPELPAPAGMFTGRDEPPVTYGDHLSTH